MRFFLHSILFDFHNYVMFFCLKNYYLKLKTFGTFNDSKSELVCYKWKFARFILPKKKKEKKRIDGVILKQKIAIVL